jgi:hypothetical protein
MWAGIGGVAIVLVVAVYDQLKREYELYKRRHYKCYLEGNRQ